MCLVNLFIDCIYTDDYIPFCTSCNCNIKIHWRLPSKYFNFSDFYIISQILIIFKDYIMCLIDNRKKAYLYEDTLSLLLFTSKKLL